MKTKRTLCILLSFVFLLSIFTPATAASSDIKVILNGKELAFDVPPQMINNRTMVPMRKIFEELGAAVEWEGTEKKITATKDDIVIIMQIDNRIINVSGKDIELDVPPMLVNGRTLVPARAVAESLEAEVLWEGSTRTVTINKKEDSGAEKDSGSEESSPSSNTDIVPIDLEKETDFVCNVGATITYGFGDVWSRTVGTEYIPHIKLIDKAYRGQTLLICPLYANFAIDDKGYAKVTYTLKVKKAGSEEFRELKDIAAIDGQCMPNQIIKSAVAIEYTIDDTDPLGTYTFIIESNDTVGGKTTSNTFTVDFQEYKYTKNEFSSFDEFMEYICNYSLNPDPDRIIDAVIYAEKNELVTYPIILSALIEMLAKNPYLEKAESAEFKKLFGNEGTPTLNILMNSAVAYRKTISGNNPQTIMHIVMANNIDNIMFYGSVVGTYFASASYDAAKKLAESLTSIDFSEKAMKEYMVPSLKELAKADPLFNAYCVYMKNYDNSIDESVKKEIEKVLE